MDEKRRLLDDRANRWQVAPARIEATETWRKFLNSGDSLEIAELTMALEEELRL